MPKPKDPILYEAEPIYLRALAERVKVDPTRSPEWCRRVAHYLNVSAAMFLEDGKAAENFKTIPAQFQDRPAAPAH